MKRYDTYESPSLEILEINVEQPILQSSFGTKGYGESEETEW